MPDPGDGRRHVDQISDQISGVLDPLAGRCRAIRDGRPWSEGSGRMAGEGALLEVRLHAPVLDAVVVRVSGVLNAESAPLLAERVGQQLARAPHIVVDLHEVGFLSPCCLWVLRMLHRQAAAVGTQLHLVAEHDAVCAQLHLSGLDQVIRICPSAELVVAGLAPRSGSRGSRSGR